MEHWTKIGSEVFKESIERKHWSQENTGIISSSKVTSLFIYLIAKNCQISKNFINSKLSKTKAVLRKYSIK